MKHIHLFYMGKAILLAVALEMVFFPVALPDRRVGIWTLGIALLIGGSLQAYTLYVNRPSELEKRRRRTKYPSKVFDDHLG